MREGLQLVEQALLEADVSYTVVKEFMARVTDEAVGSVVTHLVTSDGRAGGRFATAEILVDYDEEGPESGFRET